MVSFSRVASMAILSLSIFSGVLLSSPGAQAWGLRDLDPTNRNGGLREGLRNIDPTRPSDPNRIYNEGGSDVGPVYTPQPTPMPMEIKSRMHFPITITVNRQNHTLRPYGNLILNFTSAHQVVIGWDGDTAPGLQAQELRGPRRQMDEWYAIEYDSDTGIISLY